MLLLTWPELTVNAGPGTIPRNSPEVAGSDPKSRPDGPTSTENSPVGNIEIWLFRIRALLFVTVCATFGVLLIILPWTPKWTDNPLLLTSPGLRDFVSSGFIRGLASGLGILDLWLGFWEAIRYHEPPKGNTSGQ